MPTYDYQCDACGHTFEQFQSITADALKTCPACKKKKLRRLIGTGGGLIFKGGGFYITDYRSEGYKSAAKADSGGESKPKTETGSKDAPAPAATAPAEPAKKPAKPAPGGNKSAE